MADALTAQAGRQRGVAICAGMVAAVAAGFALKALAAILVPFVLAIFLLLLIDGISRAQRRFMPGWPDWTGTAIGLLTIGAAFVGAVWIIAAQAAAALSQFAAAGDRIESLLEGVTTRFGLAPVSISGLVDDRLLGRVAAAAFAALRGFASGAVLVAIYLAFLIASRKASAAKFQRLFRSPSGREDAARVTVTVRRGVGQYVWVQTVTGLLIAAASWGVMAALGQSNALLLALLIFLTSYVPVIGPALGVFVPPLFALAQFAGWREAVILLVALQAINFAVNNIMVPRMQADRLNLDPTVVLLSLGLWGFLWGLPGALLSTPLTVMVLAVSAEVPALHWLAVLLSTDGRLATDEHADPHPEKFPRSPL